MLLALVADASLSTLAASEEREQRVRVEDSAPRYEAFASIELEGTLVVELELGVLVLLAQEAVADRQHLDLAAHEAADKASCGVHTIGSPRTLNEVLTSTGHPVSSRKREISA